MEITLPNKPGYDFGIGIERLSGDAMNKVVIEDVNIVKLGGAIQTFEVSRIRTSSELEQHLGINIEASYGCASFGAGVSARFSFTKDTKIQSSSLFLAVTATVHLANRSINEPKLTPEAGAMVDKPDIFTQRYGNMFARACKGGGVFIGIIQVDTNSEEESSNIEAELKGTYGLFSADASMKFSNTLSKYKEAVYCSVYSEGGPSIHIEDPSDPVKMLGLANTWMSQLQANPEEYAIPYEWTFSPITIAEGPIPPNAVDVEHAQDVLKFCARQRSILLDQLNLLTWIISHPERYDWNTPQVSMTEIQKAAKMTQADLDIIADCASAALNHPKEAKFPNEFSNGSYPSAIVPPLPNPLPVIRVPNMVGVFGCDIGYAQRCISRGTVDECFAGTVDHDSDGHPVPIDVPREVADFLDFVKNGQLKLTVDPGDFAITDVSADGKDCDNYRVTAQNPSAGTLVKGGTEVSIKLEES